MTSKSDELFSIVKAIDKFNKKHKGKLSPILRHHYLITARKLIKEAATINAIQDSKGLDTHKEREDSHIEEVK